jgi:hypothetical protein
MSFKHMIILTAGLIGISVVVLSPRWLYPAHALMPQERVIGYRLITNPPEPMTTISGEDGRKTTFIKGQGIDARIDYRDLSLRVGLIVVTVALGLLMLRVRKRQKKTGSPNEERTVGKSIEGTPNKGMHRSAKREFHDEGQLPRAR